MERPPGLFAQQEGSEQSVETVVRFIHNIHLAIIPERAEREQDSKKTCMSCWKIYLLLNQVRGLYCKL